VPSNENVSLSYRCIRRQIFPFVFFYLFRNQLSTFFLAPIFLGAVSSGKTSGNGCVQVLNRIVHRNHVAGPHLRELSSDIFIADFNVLGGAKQGSE
jgi:hypothetical protein